MNTLPDMIKAAIVTAVISAFAPFHSSLKPLPKSVTATRQPTLTVTGAVPRGAKVALLFGSANRDPRVFGDPDAFDVGRTNAAEHIGFGGGIHVCIGAPLARVELEAALRALVERAPGLSLAEEPRRNRAFVIWGLEGLEVSA